MFYFKFFNCDATFDEKTNTLAYAGDHQSFSMKINDSKIRTVYFKFNNECNLKCQKALLTKIIICITMYSNYEK